MTLFTETPASRNSRLNTLSKLISGYNQMGAGNVSHCIHNGLVNLHLHSKCPHGHPRILIKTTEEFRSFDNFTLLTMSVPAWNFCHIKLGSFQFAPYFKEDWPGEFEECGNLEIKLSFSQRHTDNTPVHFISPYRFWPVYIYQKRISNNDIHISPIICVLQYLSHPVG